MWLLVQVFGEDELADRLLAVSLTSSSLTLASHSLRSSSRFTRDLICAPVLLPISRMMASRIRGSCCSSNLRSAASVAISSTVTRT